MRRLILSITIIFISLLTKANTNTSKTDINYLTKLDLELRMDGEYILRQNSDKKFDDYYGFAGKYMNLVLGGQLGDKVSYSFRYRLVSNNSDPKEFFKATDIITLDYKINRNWSINAGKQVVGIGGYEYDVAPISIFYASAFWNNCTAYQFGVSTSYLTDNSKHKFSFQFQNSPFSTQAFDSIFAYNFMWYGNISENISTISSVNFIEYEKGRYINYIAIGAKVNLGKLTLEMDWMNRASSLQENFFSDYSVILNAIYKVNDSFSIFSKSGYDQNLAQEELPDPAMNYTMAYDRVVLPGTKYHFYGLGAEFYPLKKNRNDLRLHFFWAANNSPSTHTFNLGLTWYIRFVAI